MNCPSRNDNTSKHPHWNQTPPALTADLTTRADLNGIANIRDRNHAADASQLGKVEDEPPREAAIPAADKPASPTDEMLPETHAFTNSRNAPAGSPSRLSKSFSGLMNRGGRRLAGIMIKYLQFIGPGFLIAVAYIDPGNYATDVNGRQHRLRLLASGLSFCPNCLIRYNSELFADSNPQLARPPSFRTFLSS